LSATSAIIGAAHNIAAQAIVKDNAQSGRFTGMVLLPYERGVLKQAIRQLVRGERNGT
jgi:hypothetical protein